MPVTQLLDLPAELLAQVRDGLPVRDRVRFSAALPKATAQAVAPPGPRGPKSREHTLGVLAGAVRKRRLKKISPQIREFMCTVPRSDPTWAELEEGLPELRDVPYVPQIMSLYQRLWHGKFTIDDLPEILIQEPDDAVVSLARLPPNLFDAITALPGRAQELLLSASGSHAMSFAYGLLNYRNRALLRHLLVADAGPASLRASVMSHLLRPLGLIIVGHNDMREDVFELLTLSAPDVLELYENALSTLNMEAALFYEKHLHL